MLLVIEYEVYPFVEMWAETYSRDLTAFSLVDVDKTHLGNRVRMERRRRRKRRLSDRESLGSSGRTRVEGGRKSFLTSEE